MQFVGKLVTSVSDFYRDLNPATLTGAMDVIVVEDVHTKERACTPFHVRIGKLNLMRPQDKRVEVLVNGEVQAGVEMKVGEAGEAFFVVPEEDVIVRAGNGVDSGGEDDLSLLSTSPLPPPPLSPFRAPTVAPHAPHEDEFTLSPKKEHRKPALGDTLSDTELDYSAVGQSASGNHFEMWLDIFDYLTKEERVRKQVSEMRQLCAPETPYKLTMHRVPWPLEVHPPRDFPMIIEHTVGGRQLVLTECLGDLQRYAVDPRTHKHLVLSVDAVEGRWWFAGRQAVIMAVCLGLFNEVPDLEHFKDTFFPATSVTSLATSVTSLATDTNGKKQSAVAPTSWRHWWSRTTPDATSTMTMTPPSTLPANQPIAPANQPIAPATQPIPIPTGQPTQQPTQHQNQHQNQIQQPVAKKRYLKSLRLTSEQLQWLPLKAGPNSITFTFATGRSCQSRIFLWPSDARIVISDIDGTITKSDALGHILTFVGRDWTHSGVAGLFDRVHRNGYLFVYLTARAIGQAGSTREYLRGVEQDKCQLPEGPVIMSPDRLLAALRREVIIGNPEEFKIACLKDIKRLFNDHGDPFYAGFGNRFTDAQSYHAVGIPPHRIFTVEPGGMLRVEHGLGYDSTYSRMLDVADLFFPPITFGCEGASTGREEYCDFNFWRVPVQPVDDLAAFLPPPQSTAVIAGDNVIIIEGACDGGGGGGGEGESESEASDSGQTSLMSSQPGDKEYPFL